VRSMLNSIFEQQTFVQIAILPFIVILLLLGLVSLIMLWRKGKTAEAISLLNTFLLIVVILLIIFPPNV